jgi:hypothetical protein
MNQIAELNDRFRKGDRSLGQYVITSGVAALSTEKQQQLLQLIREFNSFTLGDDPYEEHDFGKVTLDDCKYFFKIDYYDLELTNGSPDPADPKVTRRVMTIMLAEEY